MATTPFPEDTTAVVGDDDDQRIVADAEALYAIQQELAELLDRATVLQAQVNQGWADLIERRKSRSPKLRAITGGMAVIAALASGPVAHAAHHRGRVGLAGPAAVLLAETPL